MNKTSLSSILFALLVPAAAIAAPTTTPSQVSTGAIPASNVPQPTAITCDMILDNLLAEFKKPNMRQDVTATSAILVGESQAAAEGQKISSNSGGFYGSNSKAIPMGATIKGSSEVGALPTNEVYPLTFEISKGVQGKAMMKWTYRGQTYSGGVDNCSSGYWTANSSTSAVMVKLGKPYVQAVPR